MHHKVINQVLILNASAVPTVKILLNGSVTKKTRDPTKDQTKKEGKISLLQEKNVLLNSKNNPKYFRVVPFLHVAYLHVFGTITWLKRVNHNLIKDENA